MPSTIEYICAALKKREKYIEFMQATLTGNVDAMLEKAYAEEPKLTACVKYWEGNKQGGQGLLGVKTVFRLQLSYQDELPPFNEMIQDDGTWVPSAAMLGKTWKSRFWVVTRDINALANRLGQDEFALTQIQPTYKGYSIIPYSSGRNGWTLADVTLRTVVSGTQFEQYQTLAERQADTIVHRHFADGKVKSIPEVVRAFMAFSYLQQNCIFDDAADATQSEASPRDPWTQLAFGPLCRNRGIAKGIALAYRLLLDRLNVEAKIVEGVAADEGKTVPHCWCMLRIGREWYHSDPTYGINSNGTDVTRFIFDDMEAATEYGWNRQQYPACTKQRPNFQDVARYVAGNLQHLIEAGIEEQYVSEEWVE